MLKKAGKEYEHIKLDNYFKSPKTFPRKHGFPNWELPSNLKFNQLLSDLKKLKKGLIVKTKSFPKKHGAKAEPLTLRPKKYILVEGFMLYKNKDVRDFLDKKIYLDLSPKGMIERRKIRFRQNHSNEYDIKVAIPEFLKYGVMQKKYADYVVDASRSQAEVARAVKALLA
jgi:uridine kinase